MNTIRLIIRLALEKSVPATLLGAALILLGARTAPADDAAPIAIKAGKIVTMNDRDEIINDGVILLKGGKIEKLGPAGELKIPDGYRVIDASNDWIVPGLVDCHDHIAGSLSDLNDGVYLTNPGLRTVDTVEPHNTNVKNALGGGVTTVLLIPGSGNNMSGFGTICKTAGDTVEEVVVRAPGSLKIAQAGNPERYWFGVGRSFMNWNTRQTLTKARNYHETWLSYEKGNAPAPPPYDPVWNDFRGLFERKFPVSVHTQIYQVVMTTITMLHDHFKLAVMTDHSEFDGYKVAPLFKERGLNPVIGPRVFHLDSRERTINGLAAAYSEQGVNVFGTNTDAPVIPQEDLTFQATMGCWHGQNNHYAALRSITRVPAQSLDILGRCGTLEPGKDADIGVWTGSPIDPRSQCKMTLVNGKIAYDAKVKRRNR